MTTREPKMKTKMGAAPEKREGNIVIRCKPSYRAWLDRFVAAERSSPTMLIDQGLVLLAKSRGFEAPPPR